MSSRSRRIDDRNMSVQYLPLDGWSEGGVVEEFETTTTFPSVPGATARIRFRGTGIGVYGTIASSFDNNTRPLSLYTVDDDSTTETPFRGEQQISNPRYGINFYQILSLPRRDHTLTITHVEGQLYIDYFEIYGEELASPLPTGTQFNSPSGNDASLSRDFPVGTIIGGVLGSLCLIIIAIFGLFFLRRQRASIYAWQMKRSTEEEALPSEFHTDVSSPFLTWSSETRLGWPSFATKSQHPSSLNVSPPSYQEIASTHVRDQSL
ncbi:hypothetical protein FA15DRAFT_44751 [Coprinopsis marcescibilis]|uniref:Uncharacterized protein n=1 Tax=Coprinopsis marcescibilis TaxID=230819 RepID=A0A5C3KQ82_COPMA|nr:hypothetical protein FA15DRAFT_44751 [Coprinopsis marcescibilis]